MKLLLILCLIFLAKVSANTELLKISEHNSRKQDTFDQNKKKASGKQYFFNTDETSVENYILFSSHLIFDSDKLKFILLFYDLSPAQINVFHNNFTIHSDSKYYDKNKSSNSTTSLGGNNFDDFKFQRLIYWNKQNLHEYIAQKNFVNNYSRYPSTESGKIEHSDFEYAGTNRFTLSGEPPPNTIHINPLHASLMGGIALIAGVYLHVNQSAAWWDGKGTSFYFYDDWDDALFADKIGHFLGSYGISYFAREAFIYSGVSWDKSILFGSLIGIITQSYVEFKDGHALNTGFSVSDLGADIAGAAYFYLQHYIPFLQNFSPKWQYAPASMLGVPPQATTQTFLDNYNCTTAWMSVHVRNLIWGKNESFWPKWLNIGFGYGVSGYYTTEIYSRFLIGIDYNLVELLPDGFPFWNWLKQTFNLIKLPAPAIEFTKYGTNFRLLYPFTISNSLLRFN